MPDSAWIFIVPVVVSSAARSLALPVQATLLARLEAPGTFAYSARMYASAFARESNVALVSPALFLTANLLPLFTTLYGAFAPDGVLPQSDCFAAAISSSVGSSHDDA